MNDEQLQSFHGFLRSALPARLPELVDELGKLTKALPRAYAGFPQGSQEVQAALKELELKGLARLELGEWRWCREREKVEAQAQLF